MGEQGDINDDEEISKAEFERLLTGSTGVPQALQSVGVDVVGLVDFIDFIFEERVPLSLERFMDIILQLRGGNRASVKDLVELRKWLTHEFLRTQELLRAVLDLCRNILQKGTSCDGIPVFKLNC